MSELRIYVEPEQFVKARKELANSGDLAEALATQALEALNHLFETDGNTVRIGQKWYGLLTNNERRMILTDYNQVLGRNLRSTRLALNLSLADVAMRTDDEFKASVVGAYERGERAITAVRLHHLCAFYKVAVADVLPHDPNE